MLEDLFWIATGLGILLFSGEMLVRGAVSLAERARISPLLIGLTVVAFGTSAPELVIGINAAMIGGEAAGLAIGNVVGSNIANILLVLGLPVLIYPTCCKQPLIRRNTAIMIGATLIFIYLCLDPSQQITRLDGSILLGLMTLFMGYAIYRARNAPDPSMVAELTEELEDLKGRPESLGATAFFILIAMIGLPLGSSFMVGGGIHLAENAGVSPSVVGLSLIALGTSLPELATTIIAAMHRHAGVALGNVIGSNIFNLLAIMGVTAVVSPEPLHVESRFADLDLWVMLGAAMVLVPYTFLHLKVGRLSGIAFLVGYVVFIVMLFDRHGLVE